MSIFNFISTWATRRQSQAAWANEVIARRVLRELDNDQRLAKAKRYVDTYMEKTRIRYPIEPDELDLRPGGVNTPEAIERRQMAKNLVIEPKRRRVSGRYIAWVNSEGTRLFTPTSERHTAWIHHCGDKILYVINVYARQK